MISRGEADDDDDDDDNDDDDNKEEEEAEGGVDCVTAAGHLWLVITAVLIGRG